MKMPIKLSVLLPNVPDIEVVAIKGLEHLCEHLDIADEKIGEARILVNESIINALEHSDSERPEVKVEFAVTQDKLVIVVEDYGKGFDPKTVEEPDIKEKMGSSHKRGWGLKLMKSMSDDFKIESGPAGTQITMTKNLA
jgi:serine/threonine-protein kinase RsbW